MFEKPFRSPLLKQIPSAVLTPETVGEGPPAKRRRLDHEGEKVDNLRGPQLVFKHAGISSLPRKPLLAVKNPNATSEAINPLEGGTETYYNVLW